MKLSLTAFTAILLLAAIASLYQPRARAEAAAPVAKIGAPAPDFTLPNVTADNQSITLSALKGKIVVISFDSVRCPVCQAYRQRFNDFYTTVVQTADNKTPVVFLSIFSNQGESANAVKAAAERSGIKYPSLKDAGASVADLYGAICTPHVFIVDAQGNLRYMGAFDDSKNPQRVSQHYVADAVTALQAGKDIATTSTEPFGCAIHR